MPTTTGLATSFITFSRPGASGGGATVTDRDGKIKWAGHNLLTNSESFDASSWLSFAATVNANVTAAPNGTTTADKICEWTGTGAQTRYQTFTVGTAGSTFTLTVYAKKDERNFITVSLSDQPATGWIAATFNLDAVTVTKSQASGVSGYALVGTPSITAIGNGWCQCVLTGTLGTAGTNYCYVGPVTTGTPTYGNSGIVNSTGTAPNGIFVWGAHLYRSDLGGMQQNPAMPAGMQSYYPTTVRNLLGFTEDFSNAAWGKVNVRAFGSGSVANAAVAPNGLQTADLVVPDTTNATHVLQQGPTVVNGTPYVSSLYVKPAGYIKIGLRDNAAFNRFVTFNLTGAGSVISNGSSSTGTITALSDGWYRIQMSATGGSAGNSLTYYFLDNAYTSGDPLSYNYAGDGTSGIYLWGAQLSDSASLDTYVPVYGAAVTSAAYYAPRLDYDPVTLAAKGLLVEEARTNVILHANDFSQAAWVPQNWGTISADQATAPDGTPSADKLILKNGQTNTPQVNQDVSATNGLNYTLSIYAKKAEKNSIILLGGGSLSGAGVRANLTTGLVTGTYTGATLVSSSVTPVANGYFRVAITVTATSTGTGTILIRACNDDGSAYAGNGVDGIYLWGAQVESNASFATSYIPTGSATATRAADVASVSTQAFPYSASEGTLVANASWAIAPVSTLTNQRIAMMGSSGDLYARQIQRQDSSATGVLVFYRGMSGVVNISTTGNAANAGLAWSSTGGSASVNGSAASALTGTPTTSDGLPINTLRIGNAGDSTFFNGHIRQITYIPRRLANAELQSRTA